MVIEGCRLCFFDILYLHSLFTEIYIYLFILNLYLQAAPAHDYASQHMQLLQLPIIFSLNNFQPGFRLKFLDWVSLAIDSQRKSDFVNDEIHSIPNIN